MNMAHKNARNAQRDTTVAIVETKKPQVFASLCPVNKAHTNTRIYSTKGRTRYCVCDDCGETWKQIGEQVDEAK